MSDTFESLEKEHRKVMGRLRSVWGSQKQEEQLEASLKKQRVEIERRQFALPLKEKE